MENEAVITKIKITRDATIIADPDIYHFFSEELNPDYYFTRIDNPNCLIDIPVNNSKVDETLTNKVSVSCSIKGIDWTNDINSSSQIHSRISSKNPLTEIAIGKYKELIDLFIEEFNKHPSYIKSPKSIAFNDFENISNEISSITYKDFSVELTPFNSFTIKLLLPNDELLVISKPFHQTDDLKYNEVVFSIFKNKKCLISHFLDLKDLVKSINEYLADK